MARYKVYNVDDQGKSVSYNAIIFEADNHDQAKEYAINLNSHNFYNLELDSDGKPELYRELSADSWELIK